MEPREVKLLGIYWWNAAADMKILVRVITVNAEYFTLKILAATPTECLRVQRGVAESVQVLCCPCLLEKAS
jgi:hypothetical protein